MTLWPSKQITNIDSTTKNYKIYYFLYNNVTLTNFIHEILASPPRFWNDVGCYHIKKTNKIIVIKHLTADFLYKLVRQ